MIKSLTLAVLNSWFCFFRGPLIFEEIIADCRSRLCRGASPIPFFRLNSKSQIWEDSFRKVKSFKNRPRYQIFDFSENITFVIRNRMEPSPKLFFRLNSKSRIWSGSFPEYKFENRQKRPQPPHNSHNPIYPLDTKSQFSKGFEKKSKILAKYSPTAFLEGCRKWGKVKRD